MFKLLKKKEKLTVTTAEEIKQLILEGADIPSSIMSRKIIGPTYRISIGDCFIKVPWNAKVAIDGHLVKAKDLRIKMRKF